MYAISATPHTSSAPTYPNCGRDWIICGSPSCGPCVEWNAMKKVPRAEPSTTAIAIQSRFPPSAMPTTPVATVARCASPENHTGHRCQTLPWRSARGM